MNTPKDNAYWKIRRTLERERVMRKRFLSGKDGESKVQEIDDCLEQLKILHNPVPEEPQSVPQQAAMF